MTQLQRISAPAARRLLLGAQGLLEDPQRRATLPAVAKLISRLGFVQVDTINVLARAHDLTLFSRLHSFDPGQLQSLAEGKRALFEGFTHDASVIPAAWYPFWKPRFKRDADRMRGNAWWQYHFRDTDAAAVLRTVRQRITEEGPLMSKDFEHPEKRGPWWGWKPQKAALDFLWRSGELAIRGRVNFHKVYDLAERVHPDGHAHPEPDPAAHREWACATAAERLVVFTPKELAEFWNALDAAEAKLWCASAQQDGRILPALVNSADGSPAQKAFALADYESRTRRLPEPPEGTRLLSPFDPVIRDRARGLRRFNFDYRFEAFVPEPKRIYGYYVLPILDGDRITGRLDAKLHRDRGVLEVKGLWWEAGIKPTKARRKALDEALEGLAAWLGAGEVEG
jgi:uncharacterized protein YcaQ